MKIIITEETITLSETGWSCDLVFSNIPGTTFVLRSDGHPLSIKGNPDASVIYREKK